MVDYTLADNPIEQKYGTTWKNESKTYKKYCSINKLIDHMFECSKELFKGTTHEKDYMVYHDALSLMTGKDPIEYMKTKGHWDKLIKPEFDLTKHLGCYHNRVVGNHPYVMPLDEHLNRDLQLSHDYHCIITWNLKDDDPRKFTKATPKK